jgi:predicted nucleic acid-binding Zn ribbon protein
MPTYSFYNNQTGEQFDALMKISEREDYLKNNPHIQPVVTAAQIVGGVSLTDKVPSGFKEVLSKISEKHPTSTVAQKHGRKSIKEVKTKEIVKKHLGI